MGVSTRNRYLRIKQNETLQEKKVRLNKMKIYIRNKRKIEKEN